MLAKRTLNILTKPGYAALALVVSFFVLTMAIWLPNFKLIISVLISDTASIADKFSFIGSLYGAIVTNFSVVSASYTIIIAILFGINISLLMYYIRSVDGGVKSLKGTGAAGFGGLVAGVFGIGCAACGTFVLTSVLALVGAGGAVALLPFGGIEFGCLGVGLLLYSVYMLAKKINDPKICKLNS